MKKLKNLINFRIFFFARKNFFRKNFREKLGIDMLDHGMESTTKKSEKSWANLRFQKRSKSGPCAAYILKEPTMYAIEKLKIAWKQRVTDAIARTHQISHSCWRSAEKWVVQFWGQRRHWRLPWDLPEFGSDFFVNLVVCSIQR